MQQAEIGGCADLDAPRRTTGIVGAGEEPCERGRGVDALVGPERTTGENGGAAHSLGVTGWPS